ncbi:MAG: hypothetical protein ACREQV_16770, partial [Candidatus Binatia bacterium]
KNASTLRLGSGRAKLSMSGNFSAIFNLNPFVLSLSKDSESVSQQPARDYCGACCAGQSCITFAP